jgi:hypothetical protein
VTVLVLAALSRPEAVSAQAIGTMQVSATVVPAEASWSGFSAAQRAAQELAASAASEDAGFDAPFARIELSPSSGEADRRTISILYLLN